ncbi:MAG: AAA family ATPase [Candidatus Woesearchaeota archaeon]
MTWYKEIGLKKNPFSIKPTDNNSLIGYEKIMQRIIYQIKIGNVIFLEGSYGTGKSSILKYINKELRHNILYFNYSRKKSLHKSILKNRNLLQKLLMLRPKKMLILIDEANLADSKDFDFLYEYYIMDHVKSIVFAGTNFKEVPFNKAFRSDTKLYNLNDIKANLAIEIINNRLPNQELISSVLAKRIFLLSSNNPRIYLENLEDLFRRAHELKQKKITKKDVDNFFKK